MLYLNQSCQDSSDPTWEITGAKAESRNAHTHLRMLGRISQGSVEHQIPCIIAVGAHTLGHDHTVALHRTSSYSIKLKFKTTLLRHGADTPLQCRSSVQTLAPDKRQSYSCKEDAVMNGQSDFALGGRHACTRG